MERRQRFLISTLVSVFLSIALFLLILAISNDFQKSWDLTAGKRHSFSAQTIEFMSRLEQPVKFYAFIDPTGDSSYVEDLLTRYQKLSPRFFSFEIVDLQKNPTLAERLQVRSDGQGVLEKVEKTESQTPRRERVLYFDESHLTNAMGALLRSASKNVYFLEGHGERLPDQNDSREVSNLAKSLYTEGFESKRLKLAEVGKVPEDAALVVLAGPTGSLLDKERALLDQYLFNQGKLLFLADVSTPDSYVEWMQEYGLVIGDSIIVDEVSAKVGAEPVSPIGAKLSPDHPITRTFKSLTAFTMARPVGIGEVKIRELTGEMTVLVETEETAYLVPLKELIAKQSIEFSSAGKKAGSYPLAVAGSYRHGEESAQPSPSPSPSPADGQGGSPDGETRIVLSSSTEAFTNAGFAMGGNRDFALNAINWLAESEDQITVRAKDPTVIPMSLTARTQGWLYFIFCGLVPFLCALTGILITYQRRQGGKS